MERVIGRVTTCEGDEHGYLRGHRIKVIAVLKGAARQDSDPDEDGRFITDDDELERAGGLTADDRVEVQPWLESKGRYSFVSSDPRAVDLVCYAALTSAEDRR